MARPKVEINPTVFLERIGIDEFHVNDRNRTILVKGFNKFKAHIPGNNWKPEAVAVIWRGWTWKELQPK